MIDELEQYNKEFNERIANRPVKSLMTCPKCKGSGGFYSTVCYPEVSICNICFGKKYIDLQRNQESNIKEFMIPITALSNDQIDELNRINDEPNST